MARLSERDKREFDGYLRNCTNAQVRGVYEKESRAGRDEYAGRAEIEAARRGITLEDYTNGKA